MYPWPNAKNRHNHSNLSQDIENLLFQSTLGMLRQAWPNTTKIKNRICSSHQCLTVCKQIKKSLNSFLRHWQFAISEYFGHAWICPTIPNKNDIINLQLTSMPDWSKKWRQSLHCYQRHWQLVISKHFSHAWAYIITFNQNDMTNYDTMQKMNTITQLFLEILQFIESCNLIGWEHSKL